MAILHKLAQVLFIHHHHHQVVPLARISLILSRHFSLSFISSGRSSGLHPVSSHSCCMYVRAGRPAFAWPYSGVHRIISLMSPSLLLQQCPTCLVRLTCIVFVMGGRWPYSWCLVGCCRQDLFNIARNILVELPSSLKEKKNLFISFLSSFDYGVDFWWVDFTMDFWLYWVPTNQQTKYKCITQQKLWTNNSCSWKSLSFQLEIWNEKYMYKLEIRILYFCILLIISITIQIQIQIQANAVVSDTNAFINFLLRSLATQGERHNY